jgi:BASS family bile acid:Na+ symporter
MDIDRLLSLGTEASLVMLLFATGMAARHGEGSALVRQPALLARSIGAVQLLAPVAAIVLASTLTIGPVVTVALLALAVSPMPPFIPREAPTAEGGRSYVISLIATSALLSVITIPGTLSVLGDVFGVSFRVPAIALARHLSLTVLLPFLAGLVLARTAHSFSATWSSAVGDAATLLLVVTLLPRVVATWPAIRALSDRGTLVAIVAYAVATLVAGHLLGGPARENRTTLALSATARHPALAISFVNANFAGEPLALPAVLLVAMVTLGVAAPYVVCARWWRSGSAPAGTPAAAHPVAGRR